MKGSRIGHARGPAGPTEPALRLFSHAPITVHRSITSSLHARVIGHRCTCAALAVRYSRARLGVVTGPPFAVRALGGVPLYVWVGYGGKSKERWSNKGGAG